MGARMQRHGIVILVVLVSIAAFVLLLPRGVGETDGDGGVEQLERDPATGAPLDPASPTPAHHASPTAEGADQGDENDEAASRSIRGRVIDESERPVSGASVRLTSFGGREVLVTSRADGDFEARIGDSLPLLITADAEGYVRASMTLRTHASDVEIIMRRGREVSGTVVAGDEPVVGATVLAGTARTTSGPGGVFVLEGLPAGAVRIEARRHAARSMPVHLDLSSGPAHGIVLRLEEAGSLLVVVRTTGGEPVPGANVRVTPHGWDEHFEHSADEDGRALFETLPPGSSRVVARAEGLAAAETVGEIPSEGRGEVTIRLAAAHAIVVHTRLDRGTPARGEQVHLRLVPEDGKVDSDVRTHHVVAGIGEPAVFQDVAEGTWRALAHHPTYSAEPVAVAVPGPDVTLVLEKGGKIAGRVLDEDGAPIAGAFVIAGPQPAPGEQRTDLRPARRDRSDAEGAFEIDGVARGEWRLMPRLAGYSYDEPVSARPGDRNVVLRMTRVRTIEGRVVDGRGAPMESIRVVARAMAGDGRRIARAVTGGDGAYRIENLSPGRYEVYAQRGLRSSDRQVVDAGAEGVQLVIPVGSKVVGRVIGPGGVPPSRYTVLGFSFMEASGAFEIEDLDPRETTIWFEAPGLLRKEILVELRDDRVTDVGVVELAAPARIEGTVMTTEDKPAGGATVVLEVTEQETARSHPSIVSADSEGRFSFSGLQLGRARIHAMSSDGAAGQEAVETSLRAGETATVRLIVPD